EVGGVAQGDGDGLVIAGLVVAVSVQTVVGASGGRVAEVIMGEAAGEGGHRGQVAQQPTPLGGRMVAAQCRIRHTHVGSYRREQCGGIGSGVKGLVALGKLFQIGDGGGGGSGVTGGVGGGGVEQS